MLLPAQEPRSQSLSPWRRHAPHDDKRLAPRHLRPARRPAPPQQPPHFAGSGATGRFIEEGKILTYPCSNTATLVMEDEVISQTELKPAPQRTNMIGFCEASGRTLPRQVPISSVAGSGRPGGPGRGGRDDRRGGSRGSRGGSRPCSPPCLTWPRVTCLRFLRIIV